MSSTSNTLKLLTGGYGKTVNTLSFNPVTSELLTIHSKPVGSAPTWITLNKNHSIAYVVDEWADVGENHSGEVHAFSIEPLTGELYLLSSTLSSGAWPCHSTILYGSSTSRLIISNYGGSTISSIPILSNDGRLETDISKHQVIQLHGTSPCGPNLNRNRQDRSHPHQVVVDPTNSFILAPDLGTDEIRIFAIKEHASGELELEVKAEMNLKLKAGSGPRHLLFTISPSGAALLYILNELSNSISVYSTSYATSSSASSSSSTPSISFTLLQCSVSILPSTPYPHQIDFSTFHASELVLSPSNSAILCTNRAEDDPPLESNKEGPEDLFFISKLSPEGLLIPSKSKLVSSGTRTPRHISLSPARKRMIGEEKGTGEDEDIIEEGRYLLVGGQDSDTLVIYKREEMRIVAKLESAGRPAVVLWL